MQSSGNTIHFAFYTLHIGVEHPVRSSMRMAHIVSEMNAFSANITFSHDLFLLILRDNMSILTEQGKQCKQKVKKNQKLDSLGCLFQGDIVK